jgi:hypothetical protein
VGGYRQTPAALNPGKKAGDHLHEAGWAPGPVWTSADHLAFTGIRSPDRPASSESFYRLSYLVPTLLRVTLIKLSNIMAVILSLYKTLGFVEMKC